MLLPFPARHILRRWRRRPALGLTAIVVLALGMGSTVAMHAVVGAAIGAYEPWPAADRLVRVYGVLPHQRSNPAFTARWNLMPVSWQSWRDLQQSPAFDEVAIWVPAEYVAGDEEPALARTVFVSSTLMPMLGIRPEIGRGFTADEDEDDSGAIVISHGLWTRLYGGSPDAIGRVTTVSPPGSPAGGASWRRTIVGVLPADAAFPGESPDVLFPIGFHRYNGSFGNPFFHAMARLAPGITTGAALAVAEPIVRRDEPADRRTARIVTLRADRIGIGDRPLWLMLAGAALLLVVACANVAGLLLGDARSRQHEVAVRTAMGGSRLAIFRQLAGEHAALALVAGAAGVGLAVSILPVLTSLAPPGVLGRAMPAIDWRVTGWALLAVVVATTVAGLAPGAAVSGREPGRLLRSGAAQFSSGRRWRHRLVVATQFGLALVLLVGAGLFVETLVRLGRQPLGFVPQNVAVLSVRQHRRSPASAPTPAERTVLQRLARTDPAEMIRRVEDRLWIPIQSLIDRLAALPGVDALAVSDAAPFSGAAPSSTRVRLRDRPAEEEMAVTVTSVSAGYFDALRIPSIRGRLLSEGDRAGSRTSAAAATTPVVISASLAARLPVAEPVGALLASGQRTLEIVGVVGDVRHQGLTDQDAAMVYFALGSESQVARFVVRASGDAASLLPVLRETIERHDTPMFVTSAQTMTTMVARTIVIERGRAMLSAMFGGVALVLATVGLYGLAARLVAERRREIGIRVALGAGRRAIRRLVLTDACLIVVLGLAAGVPAAFAAARLTEGLLFGVAPTAPHVLGLAAAALAVSAIAATAVPLWRATRIDPAVTLREE
jgi:ABC-type lipoprotein release transport system permease subunit